MSMRNKILTIIKKIPFLCRLYSKYYIRKTKLKEIIWGGGKFEEEINKYLRMKLSGDEIMNEQLKKRLTIDVVTSYFLYGATPQEYFMFGFQDKSHKERKVYLTNKHKDEVMMQTEGLHSLYNDLENKNNFYNKFKTYFKRRVLLINKYVSIDQYNDFIQDNSRFIVKPLNGQCGQGIEVIEVTDGNKDRVFFDLVEKGEFLLEELVIQDARMAEWNATSVNTVRMPTFIKDSSFIVLKPFFRTGRRGFVVDNGGSGGVFAMIDERTGELITDGYDENGRRYECHPDSGCKYKGWVIPRWNELLNLAEECHRNFDGHRYVGWDFALTDKGWVLIEGNWGQFLSEFTDVGGIKKQFDNLMSYRQ